MLGKLLVEIGENRELADVHLVRQAIHHAHATGLLVIQGWSVPRMGVDSHLAAGLCSQELKDVPGFRVSHGGIIHQLGGPDTESIPDGEQLREHPEVLHRRPEGR